MNRQELMQYAIGLADRAMEMLNSGAIGVRQDAAVIALAEANTIYAACNEDDDEWAAREAARWNGGRYDDLRLRER